MKSIFQAKLFVFSKLSLWSLFVLSFLFSHQALAVGDGTLPYGDTSVSDHGLNPKYALALEIGLPKLYSARFQGEDRGVTLGLEVALPVKIQGNRNTAYSIFATYAALRHLGVGGTIGHFTTEHESQNKLQNGVSDYDATITESVSTFYIAPHVSLHVAMGDHFFYEADLAWMVPIGPKEDVSVKGSGSTLASFRDRTENDGVNLENSVVLKTARKGGLYVVLARFGYWF